MHKKNTKKHTKSSSIPLKFRMCFFRKYTTVTAPEQNKLSTTANHGTKLIADSNASVSMYAR